jgi:His/Glu/Gln/Arg/opine family amino acid ABC transporter permease subunit
MLDWTVVADNLPRLLHATVRTVHLTVLTVALGTILGLLLAVLRQSSNNSVSSVVGGYNWLMRVVPTVIIMFFVYYGLPRLGLTLPAFETAVIGAGIQAGAYYGEIFRAGILSVPTGQAEAARALGLSPMRTWRRIMLPQAIRVSVPPYMSNTIIIMKGTSIASIITVDELTGVGNSIISITYRPLEILFAVTAIYLTLNTVLTLIQHWAERRWATK